ncbi:transcript variant X5 [Nothobranchius furzeri]|uniref:Transcript variant X5 n=1 Tax=Nothobranchius furzeri TaxID=105023 RepID=A0A9D3BYW0_NOTFU|nr:transcript variant X5 [Nothobranchius furzeri]
MEAREEDGGKANANLKRQREPLSDSEGNAVPAPEMKDGLKRRRLEAAGRENQSPKPSTSGRLAALQTKPDTPMIPSVRSRVQLLAQRRDVQRCFSDPGAEGSSVNTKDIKGHLLGEEEFNERLERFKAPVFQASPTPAEIPANPSPRARSRFVSGIQQKLQCSTTPSSKQAFSIRQERERELNQLSFQPISENAWLKRSNSDSSLTSQVHDDDDDDDTEMKDGSFIEMLKSATEGPANPADDGLSSHDETGTAEVIDKMFEEVLECAGNVEEKERVDEDAEDCDSGIGACSGDKDKMDTDVQKETSEEATEEGKNESNKLDSYGDELLTFPPSVILSPLSKSVEAAVTPMRLAAAQESSSSSLLLTPEETSTPPADFAPLYSVDAYRTQRQSKLPATQGVTPAAQRRATEVSEPQPLVNTKERIAALNEEAVKLQTVISQTLQALSCCTDEDHGRGSLEEAEAEKLLLVSCEKRSALLAEVTRLREEKSSESEGASTEEQQPCRGTVSITNIQLPLKVEFVCSSQNRAGRPSHYFFVLIRYGPCHIVATPLATAADARSGDAISFPTSVTLKDIRPGFEIEVEVYSLSHSSGTNSSADRPGAKSRVTPRKLLNTITSGLVWPSGSPQTSLSRRSSNFCLVGSHTISLASLGSNKFPLDKMKFEGKIRKLLGDEFQEKVPFLSPLEGNIYLKLDSEGHSDVRHQGFLTVFDLISGFGVWNRRFFVLQGCDLFYWNHPNDRETKEAEGSISLSKFPSQCVRPVNRDSCARPFTFELANEVRLQEDQNQEPLSRCWFSADTKQERLDWMKKLNQVLLDFHTWNRARPEPQQQNTTSSGNQ